VIDRNTSILFGGTMVFTTTEEITVIDYWRAPRLPAQMLRQANSGQAVRYKPRQFPFAYRGLSTSILHARVSRKIWLLT